MHYWASQGLKAKSQAVLGTPQRPAASLNCCKKAFLALTLQFQPNWSVRIVKVFLIIEKAASKVTRIF